MPLVRFVHSYPIIERDVTDEQGNVVYRTDERTGRQKVCKELIPNHPYRPARDHEAGGWWQECETALGRPIVVRDFDDEFKVGQEITLADVSRIWFKIGELRVEAAPVD